MSPLWPAAVDGGNGGLITPVSTNQWSACVTAPRSARALGGERRHNRSCQRAIWPNGLLQSMSANGAVAGASAREGGGRCHQDLFDVSVIYLFGGSRAPDRCAGASSYFTGGAAGMGGGGKGGRRDDGVAAEGCGGQSRGGETTKDEKGEESFRSDAGVCDVAAVAAATPGAARQPVYSVNL